MNCVFLSHVYIDGDLPICNSAWLSGAFYYVRGPPELRNCVVWILPGRHSSLLADEPCELRS